MLLLWAIPAESSAPAGQWWDSGYLYRQPLTVSTGAVPPLNRYNGYSVMRTMDTAALITAGKIQADCDDLRVVWWTGAGWTELDREIIGCNTATTQVWFKLQIDVADSSADDNYYVYYGNGSSPAGPADRNNVYLAFDDFESSAVGSPPSGWTVFIGNATVENDGPGNKSLRMNSTAPNTRVGIKKTLAPTERDVWVEADCKIASSASSNRYCGVMSRLSGTSAANENGYIGSIRINSDVAILAKYVAGGWTSLGTLSEAVTPDLFYRVALTTVGTNQQRVYRNGVLKVSGADSSLTGANLVGIDGYNSVTTAFEFVDNFKARRYTSPEPTVAAGSEEVLLSLVKQVWLENGTAPLALTNGVPTGTIVPAGQTIVFLIYVKNPGALAVGDLRFSDQLDVSGAGFTFVPNSLVRTQAAAPPSDTASDLTIFTATAPGTGTVLTDAVDGDAASVCDSTAAACPGSILDRITVGNTAGLTPLQANATVSVAGNTTFAIRFRAITR